MKLSREDFTVLGNNPVTLACRSGNVIDLFKENGYPAGYVSFIASDDFKTYRQIGFENTKEDIVKAYGNSYTKSLDLTKDRIYLYGKDVDKLEECKTYIEYLYREYILRFYFNEDNFIHFIVYIKNYEKISTEV